MPATVTEYAQTAQEQTLKAVKQSQQAVVEAVRTWAKSAEKIVPATPALPFADELPTAQEIIQLNFGFAEELLKAQREFVEALVAAVAPVAKKTQAAPTKTT